MADEVKVDIGDPAYLWHGDGFACAAQVVFGVQGTTKNERAFLYWGWINGFLQARGVYAFGLAACLEEMSTEQALAMVDKCYKDHREKWSEPFAEQILEALTMDGGPCKGKNPLAKP